MTNKILKGINDYYTKKVSEFGLTPKGVDWNSKESQYERFKQLSKVIINDQPLRILDFGCGYGEFYSYLNQAFPNNNFLYIGYDISDAMILNARSVKRDNDNAIFVDKLPGEPVDYSIASGVFNVKLDLAGDDEWKDYMLQTINTLNKISIKGFSFNALTKYSDTEHKRNYLFYSDPLWLFDYCKTNFSRNVALLHDYDLYEFTIIVRK